MRKYKRKYRKYMRAMYFCKTFGMGGMGVRCKKIRNGGWSPIRSKVCVKAMVGEDMGCLRVAFGQFFLDKSYLPGDDGTL